jgi:hypothetical protein
MTLRTGAEIREATAKEEEMKRAYRIGANFGLKSLNRRAREGAPLSGCRESRQNSV